MNMETNCDAFKYRKSTHLAGVDVREMIREKGYCELTIKLAYYDKGVNVNGKKQDGYFIRFEEPVKEFMPNSGNKRIIARLVQNKLNCSVTESTLLNNWTGLKIRLLFDPNRKFAGEVTGGILVDESFLSVPKKTLEEAKLAFDSVSSRDTFVLAMKDFQDFMQNKEILEKCKELSVKYPNPDKK